MLRRAHLVAVLRTPNAVQPNQDNAARDAAHHGLELEVDDRTSYLADLQEAQLVETVAKSDAKLENDDELVCPLFMCCDGCVEAQHLRG